MKLVGSKHPINGGWMTSWWGCCRKASVKGGRQDLDDLKVPLSVWNDVPASGQEIIGKYLLCLVKLWKDSCHLLQRHQWAWDSWGGAEGESWTSGWAWLQIWGFYPSVGWLVSWGPQRGYSWTRILPIDLFNYFYNLPVGWKSFKKRFFKKSLKLGFKCFGLRPSICSFKFSPGKSNLQMELIITDLNELVTCIWKYNFVILFIN